MRLFTLLCLLASNFALGDDAYFGDRERGWFWREKIPDEEKEKPKPERKEQSSGGSSSRPIDVLKQQGEDWENSLATAVLDPSSDNILKYLDKTQKINAQAMRFSDSFRKAIWINPEYDYTLKSPVTTQAIVAKNQADNRRKDEKLREISETHGLLFFFRSDCPHCHRFAPVLKKFSEEYGLTVVPVSMDGPGLPEYPDPRKNYSMGGKLKITTVPAVFILNPESNSVAPVGFGYSDWSSLQSKILTSVQKMEEGGS